MNDPNGDPQDRLRDDLRDMTAAARRDLGLHPDPDELAAYHAGALSPAGAKKVQDHLVLCPKCAAALLDIASFAGAGQEEDEEDGEDVPRGLADAVWQGVSSHIRIEEGRLPERPAPAVRPPSDAVPFPRRPAAPRRRLLEALAAALLLATIGLSVWVASLRRTVDELSLPQRNAPVFDLSTRTARGERGARSPVTVPPQVRLFTVILNPPSPRRKEYRVEVVREDGVRVRSLDGLRPDALYGSLIVTFSRHDLGAGRFRLRLFPAEGGGEEAPLEDDELRVEPP